MQERIVWGAEKNENGREGRREAGRREMRNERTNGHFESVKKNIEKKPLSDSSLGVHSVS